MYACVSLQFYSGLLPGLASFCYFLVSHLPSGCQLANYLSEYFYLSIHVLLLEESLGKSCCSGLKIQDAAAESDQQKWQAL